MKSQTRARKPSRVKIPSCDWYRWSPEVDERLAQLWLDGRHLDDIAKEFGCTPGAVKSRAARLGLVRSKQPERHCSPEWFKENNQRFCAAMQSAIDAGLEKLPVPA